MDPFPQLYNLVPPIVPVPTESYLPYREAGKQGILEKTVNINSGPVKELEPDDQNVKQCL